MTAKNLASADFQEMEKVASRSDESKSDANQGDYSGAVAKTDADEIALCRKLDRRILPVLWVMYFLNYLDRNAIAQARLNTLEKDLGLKGNHFNVAVSILFVGYVTDSVLFGAFPSKPKIASLSLVVTSG